MTKKIIILIIMVLIGALLGSGVYFFHALFTPVAQSASNQVFEIDDQVSSSKIAKDLQAKHLISSSTTFLFYIKLRQLHLQAGRYTLNGKMTIPAIARRLASGDVDEVTVTFPEGWRLTQMAERLESKGLVEKASFLDATKDQEGYLFPDTYTWKMNTGVQEIIKTMRDNFTKRTQGLNVTPEVVILASIIEREAVNDQDRPLIASVYANRLKKGLRLEADPTVQYAKGSWDVITAKDYEDVQSPYNTYLHAGWPPGPICNPGLKSLEAAINPANTDYYYFFHTKEGKSIFSKTLEEHNQNKSKYL